MLLLSLSRAARLLGTAFVVMANLSSAAPSSGNAVARQSSTDRLVFCHFIIGIVSDRTSSSDYDADMQRAKQAGIDAFALDIGTDSFTDEQLNYAYQSAADNDMKVFISFDFNWWSTSDATAVGQLIAQYAVQSAQLFIGESVFASSFAGDGLDVATMKAAAGRDVFFAPNFHPGQSDASTIDGALNWMAWDNNGDNGAPTPGNNVTVEDGDASYLAWLGTGKSYIAPVSAWFSTHYGPEVSYSKNWVFPGGPLIFDRWTEILTSDFPMLEIITWNDYGESHYMGPLDSPHYDDGASKWANDMPHDGWLDLSAPYIAAYHAGATSVDSYITSDKIVYWYRRNLLSAECDSTDNCGSKPAGYEDMQDDVYVVTLLTSPGTLTITSGGSSSTFQPGAGANLYTVPANLGSQAFELTRGTTTVLSGTSLMDITADCVCGIYNFNAYVGTLPTDFSDPLQSPDGLQSFTVGLHVTTCLPEPSLGTNPPVTTTNGGGSPTTTTTAAPPPTSTAPSSTSVCVAGTVATGESGNYGGLCSFCCNYGYCPPGPCMCTEYGTQVPLPPSTGTPGCPIAGEGAGYDGLCSFACDYGYCPDTACTTSC